MKTSFEIIWEFLAPAEQFLNRREACERLWKGLTLKKQRQIYATLVWQREQRIEIEENPYFANSQRIRLFPIHQIDLPYCTVLTTRQETSSLADRKSTRLNSSHTDSSRMPSSA